MGYCQLAQACRERMGSSELPVLGSQSAEIAGMGHHAQLNFYFLKMWGRVWWLKPVIPALWEAGVGGSRGQEIETVPINMVKPRLY